MSASRVSSDYVGYAPSRYPLYQLESEPRDSKVTAAFDVTLLYV